MNLARSVKISLMPLTNTSFGQLPLVNINQQCLAKSKEGKTSIDEGKPKLCSAIACLQLPAGHIQHLLKKGSHTPVHLATIVKYVTAEIVELTGNTAQDNKKHHIVLQSSQLTVLNNLGIPLSHERGGGGEVSQHTLS